MCEINTFVYGKIVLGKTAATVTVKFNTRLCNDESLSYMCTTITLSLIPHSQIICLQSILSPDMYFRLRYSIPSMHDQSLHE